MMQFVSREWVRPLETFPLSQTRTTANNHMLARCPACLLPGGIMSTSDLWDFLYQKKSAQGPIPEERFNIDGFYHKDNNRAGAMNVDGGYFLKTDVRQFDNAFFGINNLEAAYMDPQQRKLLEVVFQCFQDAGVSMEEISGTNTAVYVGNFTVDYQSIQSRDPDYLHRYAATGGGTSIMANRISHVFNLQGPSLTLDTACSSTIYALHQAVQAIKNGDCDGAIVAGANLIISPEQHLGTAKGGFLSPTSTCHTFDASADGYARGEGVNAIYIKRFSSAAESGNKIRSVIRGTAINANGRTPGITLPSATLQESVVRKAYQNAGLQFADTDYIECHGTGTAVGDPIEVDALASCFTAREGAPLMIGSVKTNLGHSEAASGLTSLMKVTLAFEHGMIPPTYGVKNLNTKLKLESRNMKVLNEPESWPRQLRRASVNSFGYGGANGHVILESVSSYLNDLPLLNGPELVNGKGNGHGHRPLTDEVFVLPFSAASPHSLERRRQQVSELVAQSGPGDLPSLAYTLAQRESRLRLRDFLLVTANPKPTTLEAAAPDQSPQGEQPLPFAFVFTGQGAQYAGMAKELIQSNELFLASIRKLDGTLQSLPAQYAPSWTLEQAILDPPATSKVNDVTRSQPLCTAVQIALVDLLRSWGIRPSAVIGHSSGEIAASYGAGLLSASQAILAAYFRGFAVEQLQERGAMMAAGVTPEAAQAMIDEKSLEGVRVACVNAPESVTISGTREAIETLQAELQSQQKFSRLLETGGRAYHSHMMVAIGDLYEQLVAPHLSIGKGEPLQARMCSTVGHTPESVGTVDETTNMATYFRRNLEQPVQFSSALASLLTGDDKYHLVEIGPHSALKGPIQQIRTSIKRDQTSAPYSPTIVRKEDASLCLKKLAGALFRHGHRLDWQAVNSNIPPSQQTREMLQDLPPYPFDYTRPLPWHEPRASVDIRNRTHLRHELLGTRTAAGNGIDWSWRNIPRLSEMPWLRDHKLESQVVLPGAAYVAMAIEALSQTLDLKPRLVAGKAMGFEGKSINVSAPFLVRDESDPEFEHTELHTTMCQQKISTADASSDWYEFTVSSWASDQTTLHCAGSIRMTAEPGAEAKTGSTLVSGEGYEAWSMGRWYDKSREEGLNFGPYFQSLTSLHTDGNRTSADAIATTHLQPPSVDAKDVYYAAHTITIDACIQAAIMGGTAGNLSTLRAYVPIFISEFRIQVPSGGPSSVGAEECRVHTRMERTGLSSRKVDCTLRLPDGTPAIDLKDLRMSLYTGKAPVQAPSSIYLQRHPCLRILWRPDILRVHPGAEGALRDYVGTFSAQQAADMKDNESLLVFGAMLDLISHKFPRMRVLELGSGCECAAKQCLSLLDKDTAFPRCRSWVKGDLDEENKLCIQGSESPEPFDVVLIKSYSTAQGFWKQSAKKLESITSDRSVIITRSTDEAVSSLEAAGFVLLKLPHETLLAVPGQKKTGLEGKEVLVLKPNKSSSKIDALVTAIGSYLGKKASCTVSATTLDGINSAKITAETVCISLLEIEGEFLATMSADDMNRLRLITDVVTRIVWLTGADMMAAPNPDLTLSSGLSRALMLEQPSLRFAVLDIGAANTSDPNIMATTCENLTRVLGAHYATDDTEFIQCGTLLHVSRFVPDLALNAMFRERLEEPQQQTDSTPVATATLEEVAPAKIAIGQVGMTDTIHFQQISEPPSVCPPGYVDVDLRAVSLNAKDIYAMSGRVETRGATMALDFSGVISAVGPDITHLRPGDRVAGLAPNHFGTTERVPAASCHKMLPDEEFTVLPTLLTVYSTALFALRDRASLRAGESVLIHAGAGAFGLAAIAMAQHMGATVYTTAGSTVKREYLVREMGVPAAHIFNSRDASFVEGIRAATGGRGVDVVVNSLVGDLMHASWGCIASFGRFVEIGKRELINAGKLDMHAFLKNSTFTAFDLSEFFYAEDPHYRNIFYGLIAESLELYRAGKVKAPPIATFDVSDIAQAYRYFNNKDRVGKVVVSMENPKSRVPVVSAKYKTIFDANKAYLLIGCLGGLGRSLSRWMVARGARKFVFLGRSGCDKPTAQQLVSRLQSAGATVTVVRGDVANAEHVKNAVAACTALGPIGGVVQAAMGLKEALFTRMTNAAWHTGIQPKWSGTWNLHYALEGHDDALDFFVMTSSLSGSCGTATESNYCAANGFLDAFAQWRRAHHKPAVSLGLGMISEVGYLHENPEIEALLLRKGIQPLNEEEFLQVVDLGLAGPGGDFNFAAHRGSQTPALNLAHILTGLEPLGIRKLMDKGFDVNNGIMEDARTSLLAASLLAEQDANESGDGGADASQLAAAAAWVKEVPSSALAMFGAEVAAASLQEAILRLAKRRFSNLILMPMDQVDERKPLPSFGVDSMLAAEFRTWFWNTFKVDIPFLDIVSPQKALVNLSEFVETSLVASWAA
ncbi:polyketide synthase [Apiospora rasikravindrae]|uniref:Polyketide synthase n=1 Tax=Apiospora rasikravindrae TaxID=990691 RepID=A0ABR1S2Z3_9PEZI